MERATAKEKSGGYIPLRRDELEASTKGRATTGPVQYSWYQKAGALLYYMLSSAAAQYMIKVHANRGSLLMIAVVDVGSLDPQRPLILVHDSFCSLCSRCGVSTAR